MVRYFQNATDDELLLMRESLQRRGTTGELSMSTFQGDQNMVSWMGAQPPHIVLLYVMDEQWRRDPTTYENPWKNRHRRSSPDYSQCY
jgi:hypothetical protein